MKRLRQLSIKTKVFDKKGMFSTRTALTIERSNSSGSTNISTNVLGEIGEEAIVNENTSCDDSLNTQRNINTFCNWEKLRTRLQRASLEECYMESEQTCVVCHTQPAEIRCPYCGPRQYFCQTCAYSLHEERNQFHVMEKWMVHTYTAMFWGII